MSVVRGVGGVCDRVWEGDVVLSLCLLRVWILCVDGRPRYLYIVLAAYLHILGAPIVQSCCTLSISANPNLYMSVADIANPDLFSCVCRTWIRLDISRFYEEQYQPSSESA